MEPTLEPGRESSRRTRTKANGAPAKWFLLFWFVMIGIGVTATYYYSQHIKVTMLTQLETQTNAQIQAVQKTYQEQLHKLETKLVEMQSKIDSFNELLTFTKDNASNKTDNSNKLYTQLNEVKKQLDTLKKKMDLLK
ncbi:hypothetical protein MH117_20555 [Paenibacillus sp. ACRRX]|uniref:hypothetical protein n=1 Tax=unclassified Paenibacillus TaxID=185978 RepID=UPI001EF678DB|nr:MULTISPECIES: hypothetical protein [unclassified Paenibacillus]MCG7409802.1 hypothetical protein [Paenibacillus sp. ACRRX]MDK8183130.1 hypothetical protein [Paenibacillus sp. UMB4589-SE434]